MNPEKPKKNDKKKEANPDHKADFFKVLEKAIKPKRPASK